MYPDIILIGMVLILKALGYMKVVKCDIKNVFCFQIISLLACLCVSVL